MAWNGRTPVHQFHKMAGSDLVTTSDWMAHVDSLESGARVAYTNDATPTVINGYRELRSRGTFAAPTAVAAEDRIGKWSMEGYHSTGTPGYAEAAVIYGHVDGTPSGNFVPGRIGFFTGTAAAIPAERVRITADGDLQNRSEDTFFSWDDGNNNRLGFNKKAGQGPRLVHGSAIDFVVARSSGASISPRAQTSTVEFQILADGNARFFGNLTVDGTLVSGGTGGTFTTGVFGSDAAAGSVFINGPAASLRPINWQTASGLRWRLAVITDAESGGGAGFGGATLRLSRFNNSGASETPVVDFDRATGLVTFGTGIAVTTGTIQATNGQVITKGTDPTIEWWDTDPATDTKRWHMFTGNDGVLAVRTVTDAGGVGANIIQFHRSGATPNLITVTVPITTNSNITFSTAAFLGWDAGTNALRFDGANGPYLNSGNHAVVNLDSDNTNTGAYFAVRHNASTFGGGTTLFQVFDNAAAAFSLGLNVAGTLDVNSQFVQVGTSGSGNGGVVAYVDDSGAELWRAGIEAITTGRDWVLRHHGAGINVLRVQNSNRAAIWDVRDGGFSVRNNAVTAVGIVTTSGVHGVTITSGATDSGNALLNGTDHGVVSFAAGGPQTATHIQFIPWGVQGGVIFETQHAVFRHSSLPRFSLYRTGMAANTGRWDFINNFGDLVIRAGPDGGDAGAMIFFQAQRNIMAVEKLTLTATVFAKINSPVLAVGSATDSRAWSSGYRAIEFSGGRGALWDAGDVYLSRNVWHDGSNPRAIQSGNAQEILLGSDQIIFRFAPAVAAANDTYTIANAFVDVLNVTRTGGATLTAAGGNEHLLTLSGAAATDRWVRWSTGANPRWLMGASSIAETPAHAGSDFYVASVNDSGVETSRLVLTRLKGVLTLLNNEDVTPGIGLRLHQLNTAQAAMVAMAFSNQYVGADLAQVQVQVSQIGNNSGGIRLAIRNGATANMVQGAFHGYAEGFPAGAIVHDFAGSESDYWSVRFVGNGESSPGQLQLHYPGYAAVYMRNSQGSLFIYPNANTSLATVFFTNGNIGVTGSVNPNVNNAFGLGQPGACWAGVCVGGVAGQGFYFGEAGADSGFYWVSDGEVAIKTNAVNRLYINSSGTVYPGTNNVQWLGTDTARWAVVYGVTSNFSSRRQYKEVFGPADPQTALDAILATDFVEFRYLGHNFRQLGYIAEDAHPYLTLQPILGQEWDGSINPQHTASVAAQAVKVLHARQESDRERVARLEAEVAQLRQALESVGWDGTRSGGGRPN